MRKALALASQGRGRVHPNPMVGAVLVRDGREIASGYHRAYGGPHAEIEALRRAGTHAKGATLYVTLEPCSHWGKTPPCADALLRAGVTRVVSSMKDPNPLVSGRGFSRLRARGVAITSGVLLEEARFLNRAFITRITKHRPYITLKVASSLDGRTATVTGESKWITSSASRAQGHRLRAEVDAIAVGAGTVLADNPSLTAHGKGRDPIRIIFQGKRALPKRLNIFDLSAETWVLRQPRGVKALKATLAQLAERGVTHLLVEGGATLQKSFWDAGVVDEVAWFVAPVIIGSHKRLQDAWRLPNLPDWWARGEVKS